MYVVGKLYETLLYISLYVVWTARYGIYSEKPNVRPIRRETLSHYFIKVHRKEISNDVSQSAWVPTSTPPPFRNVHRKREIRSTSFPNKDPITNY